ncbi:MAG: TetR/AcrR family transcriptional regulator [Anaerolineaceae bacterium]|nr:TetR/AcrR family transcriptional regulator [Anaerolineaceae bacterium]
MSKKGDSNRRYDSTRRQIQARQTQQIIIEAARRLFIERGYAGAAIGAIAQEAGVAPETIYATFGNKRAILAQLVHVSVVGDDEPQPLLERPAVQETAQEIDQRQQIRMFAGQICTIMGRMAPIFEVMRTAAKTEPDIAEMRERMLQERRQGMVHFVRAVAAHGTLRGEMSIEAAADVVFALSSGEMFTVLTVDLGWSDEQYQTWLADAVTTAILPEPNPT